VRANDQVNDKVNELQRGLELLEPEVQKMRERHKLLTNIEVSKKRLMWMQLDGVSVSLRLAPADPG